MALEHTPQKVADTLAASSAAFAGVSWLADVEPVISIGAGLVAIVAGLAATWYHVERAIQTHARRREERIAREIEDRLSELDRIKEELRKEVSSKKGE